MTDKEREKIIRGPVQLENGDVITWEEQHRRQIERWNKQEYVQRIRAKMEKFKPLFADMKTPAGFSYDNVLVCSAPDYISFTSWTGQFSGLELEIEITGRAMRRCPDITLLHEMIHLHEYLLTDQQRKDLLKKLFDKLSGEIPDLVSIMYYSGDIRDNFFDDKRQEELHSDLFFLKSLDIDLHFPKKYKLGTVGNYGFDVAIDIIQRQLANGGLKRIDTETFIQ